MRICYATAATSKPCTCPYLSVSKDVSNRVLSSLIDVWARINQLMHSTAGICHKGYLTACLCSGSVCTVMCAGVVAGGLHHT